MITLTATVEAESEEEALYKAEELEPPQLCFNCERGHEGSWAPGMDGEPQNIEISR